MIAIDTNVLIYAFRPESEHHARAKSLIEDAITAGQALAICWPCVHEFISIVTHPTRLKPPSSIETAFAFLRGLAEAPGVRLLHETTDHLTRLERLLIDGGVRGPAVHDARIATICLSHGVLQLWTADRDFARFPSLTCVNPLR